MKSLSIKQIVITILVSYLVTAFINAELNPFNLSMHARFVQVSITLCSLVVQLGIKNSF
jgi:hypothetical protein